MQVLSSYFCSVFQQLLAIRATDAGGPASNHGDLTLDIHRSYRAAQTAAAGQAVVNSIYTATIYAYNKIMLYLTRV